MTDRDLFYCGRFDCDGHARSNEKCSDLYCDVSPEECEPKPAPTYTVSGNRMVLTRLDPEGNPVGEPVEYPGPVSFDIPEGSVSDATVLMDSEGFSSLTLDIEMGHVDPDILSVLTGDSTLADTMKFEFWYSRQPWYKRLLWWAQDQWRRLPGVGR